MGKIFGNGCSLAFASRLSFVVIAVGLMSHKSAAQETIKAPFWSSNTNNMYYAWSDIGAIGSYVPGDNFYSATLQEVIDQEDVVTFVIPIKDQPNKLVVSLGKDLGIYDWDGKTDSADIKHESMIKVLSDDNSYISTGTTDDEGTLWLVSAPKQNNGQAQTSLLMWVNSGKTVSQPIPITGLRDGIAFRGNQFYYTYGTAKVIMKLDYDSAAKTFSNSITVYDMAAHNRTESPLGLTVDKRGILWVACSSYVLGINPADGSELPQINLPRQDGAYTIFSVAFGSKSLTDLYGTLVTEKTLNYLVNLHQPDTSTTGVAGVPVTFT